MNREAGRQIADSLEKYFSKRVLAPLIERENEVTVNKAFFLGKREYEYVSTLSGHEPTVNYPDES